MFSLDARSIQPDITVIEVAGRVTLGRESAQLETAVLKALSDGARKLVIDVSKVSFIDSTGIGMVVFCFGKIKQANAEARVAGAAGLVMDVFRLTRLDSVIRFVPDTAAACASFGDAGQST